MAANKLVALWNQAEGFLFGFLNVAAVAVAFYGVIMRYVFRAPPFWTEEVCLYLIIWAVFIAASTLAEERGHVGATLLVERFPVHIRRILAVINGIVCLGFCGIICWYGFQIVWQTYACAQKSSTALRFPLWIAYLAVATGCLLVGIRYMLRIYRLLFRFQESDILETHEMSREGDHR
jgi:C4-dicarboxylate transporter DctQ subunit